MDDAVLTAGDYVPALSREKNFPESQITNRLLTKLFRSRCKGY